MKIRRLGKALAVALILVSALLITVEKSDAVVISGTIQDWASLWPGPYPTPPLQLIGDGTNYVEASWSSYNPSAGYFYGSGGAYGYYHTNTDVYRAYSVTDINQITDASVYTFNPNSIVAAVNNFVVFRNTQTDFYGVLRIDSITDHGSDPPTLNGTWWFQTDGTGNFSANASVPEPGTLLLLGSGLVGLVGYGRRRMKK